ncbi:MAG: ATP-binding protein [Oscillospiraceae bacterium]|jgi:predicted AAA+ superfamily ATPase|nr:ATP-binding protein [Oscillospiraceae bacterium]
MEYITRSLESKFIRMSEFFKVVLVTGARQVGKTTMLKHLAGEHERTYVTLDNTMARNLARTDPALFFQTYKPPIIIDEVQYAPELFSYIKIICDESEDVGRFWLTGSQQYNMMKNVRESLAGRIGILELYSMSKNEIDGVYFDDDLDFSLPCLQARQSKLQKFESKLSNHSVGGSVKPSNKNDISEIFEYIWRGGMPQTLYADIEQRQEYFEAYTNTYLMRDVAQLGGVTDTLRFSKFLIACAAIISNQVNFKTLAETAEISQPTAKEWLRILEGLGIVYLLRPYANNTLKRLAKTPKLYFYDTGLAAHLLMWTTKDILMNGAASGHFFENFVVIGILKNYAYSRANAFLSYFRDSNTKEIDLLIERSAMIHPLEIKMSANPNNREIKKFAVLNDSVKQQGYGGIICMCQEVIPIDVNNCFIPCNLL